jgi:hypothetical protein
MPPAKRGPGRPQKDPDDLKHRVDLMLSAKSIAWLDAVRGRTGISRAALVELYIRLQIDEHDGDPIRAAKTSSD